MPTHITETRYVGGHTIWPRSSDGPEGEVSLASELYGEIFEPLRQVEYFQTFQFHHEPRTIVAVNGADFAPEFLRASVRVAA